MTSSGLHGANRLASNSLLEGLVYGTAAAGDIVRMLVESGPAHLEVPPIAAEAQSRVRKTLDLNDIRESLRSLMWRQVGIIRDGRGLAEASEQVDFWCRYALNQVFHDPSGWVLQNMLIVARLMIAAAATRQESRGVHTRADFPATDPAWTRHIPLRRPALPGETL